MATGNGALLERHLDAMADGGTDALIKAIDATTTPDFTEEWPQSGEIMRSRDAVKRVLEGYEKGTGTTPRMKARRVVGSGDVWVAEATIDYGDGVPVSYVGIAEFRNGKMTKITEYFANPFEAPAWRADLVERTEPVAV